LIKIQIGYDIKIIKGDTKCLMPPLQD